MRAFVLNSDKSSGQAVLPLPANGEKNNVFPDALSTDVQAGTVRDRKLVLSPEVEIPTLRVCIGTNAAILICSASNAEIEPSEDAEWKGTGALLDELAAGAIASFDVSGAIAGEGFSALDIVRISDDVHEDFIRVKSVQWNGNNAVLTLVPNSVLGYGYAAGASVSACVERGLCGRNDVWIREIIAANSGYEFIKSIPIRIVF